MLAFKFNPRKIDQVLLELRLAATISSLQLIAELRSNSGIANS